MQKKWALTLDDAKAATVAARAEAVKNGWNVVIAVVDDGGHLIHFERADGTQKGSCVVAIEKARTAVMFRRPSAALEKIVKEGAHHMTTLPGATPIEGGEPVMIEGECIGAVGVSGVTSAQDGIVARAGVAALVKG